MLSRLTLDDAGMSRCRECGKIYDAREQDSGRCRECLREQGEAIAAEVRRDPESELREKTQRLMALFNPVRPSLAPRQVQGLYIVPQGPVCARCKRREPIEDSDFCLTCHLELDNVLGTASRDLLSRVELYEPARKRSRGASVMDTYGEKASEKNKNAVVPPHSQSPRVM